VRVLVLGGTRFIGRAVVEQLLQAGHEVTLLNRGRSPDPFATRVRRVLGDRRDPETIRRAASLRDHSVVVDITAYQESDTRAVVEAFRDRTGHLIHISTASVYLIRERCLPPFSESQFAGRLTPARPRDSAWTYARHKRQCEEVLLEAHAEHGFPFTSLRVPIVVGCNDYTRRADAYLERLASGGPVILPEGGLNSWGFLWVEDLAEVIVSNLARPSTLGRAYNLAQREALCLRQLVEMFATALGREAQVLSLPADWLRAVGLGTAFSPYSHDRDILLDCQAAKEDMLFRPTSPDTWVELLVRDFRRRWDGTPRAFPASRAFELRLAREVARIRLPSYPVAAADS
jgi:nucleoside-diphosphate-sugar epimerase